MGKNIIILSDGTNQKGGVGHNTNVYKLFNMLENRTDRQTVYYDPGLGTGAERLLGALTGRGFTRNILECYRFIFEQYKAGDKLYLFGFSRGAATVRSLSGFLHLFGVLPQSREDIIQEAFQIYKIMDKDKQQEEADHFLSKHHTMWTRIHFLGVWDTVAALGIPNQLLTEIADRFFPHKFHNFDLSASVDCACQALAIDEKRKTFAPVLWNKLPKGSKQKMKQVWFCGVHTDVGGGYAEPELSDITLKWMIKQAMAEGLLIYNPEKNEQFKRLMGSVPNVNGPMHNEQLTFPGKWFRSELRRWDFETLGNPCIHQSVLERLKNCSNLDDPAYSSWILETFKEEERVLEPWD